MYHTEPNEAAALLMLGIGLIMGIYLGVMAGIVLGRPTHAEKVVLREALDNYVLEAPGPLVAEQARRLRYSAALRER